MIGPQATPAQQGYGYIELATGRIYDEDGLDKRQLREMLAEWRYRAEEEAAAEAAAKRPQVGPDTRTPLQRWRDEDDREIEKAARYNPNIARQHAIILNNRLPDGTTSNWAFFDAFKEASGDIITAIAAKGQSSNRVPVSRSMGMSRLRPPPSGIGRGTSVVTDTIGDLRAADVKDAHHVIQDAAVKNLPGYDTNLARGVQLRGPSTERGTPHYFATQVQREAGGGTYAAERRIGYKALRRAGWSEPYSRQAIDDADEYFSSIGIRMDTVTKVPGNR